MPRVIRLLVPASLAAFVACSSGGREVTSAPTASDASVADVAAPLRASEAIVRALRQREVRGLAASELLPPSTVIRFDDSPIGLRAIVPPARGVHEATVTLPRTSAGSFRVDVGAALLIDVAPRYPGRRTAVPAEIADGYAVYVGAHGPGTAAVHRVTAEGTEDYVSFTERPDDERLVYDVHIGDGIAGLRLVGDALELLDGAGAPRLRMAPPYVVGADGERFAAHVTVSGCAVDESPAPPWNRAVVPPGERTCRVDVRWSGAAYPLVVDPSWVSTSGMTSARYYHTATLLSTGKILAVGGSSTASAPQITAELFDPVTRTFASTGSMASARYYHAAVKLDDGLVVVSGGYSTGSAYTQTAERYNPATGTWSAAGTLPGIRGYHRGVLLQNGKILVSGGYNASAAMNGGVLYDPTTNAWTSTGSMLGARYLHALVTMSSGKVLAAGGYGSTYLATAETYDPTTGTWTTAPAMAVARYYAAYALLPSGKVLVAGGNNGTTFATAVLFDPTTSTWSNTGSMLTARYGHDAAVLSGGRVLTSGGASASTLAEIYDAGLGTWSAAVPMNVARAYNSLTAISGAAAVAIGGSGTTSRQTAEVYSGAETCTTGTTCTSGNCADGFCCDTPCTGACNRCDVSGSEGTCKTVVAGTAGRDPACTPFACDGAAVDCPTSCTTNAQCDSAFQSVGTACVPKLANGVACSAGTECASGHCSDTVCCSAACSGGCDVCTAALGASGDGTCTTVTGAGTPSCAPYVCSGSAGSCPVSCSSDTSCISTHFCQTSTCVVKRVIGTSCTTANQCQSGNCVDGYCCNDACAGACDRCNVSGSLGTCSIVAATSAGSPSCAPYVCNGSSASCPPSCTFDTDCASTAMCSGGACISKLGTGVACSTGAQCLSGSCVDNVCCTTTCAGACNACSIAAGATSNGTCVNIAGDGAPSCAPFRCSGSSSACPISCTSDTSCATGKFCSGNTCIDRLSPGVACTLGTQCASGFCVDGVCCGSACAGSCDRCSVAAGAAVDGTCSSVTGAGAPSCSPYLCTGASPSCPVSCASDSECVAGSYCASGVCTLKKSNGFTCASAVQCTSDFCADGVCCNSACDLGPCNRCDLSGSLGTCRVAPLSNPGAPACSPYSCDGISNACPTACSSDATCAVGFACVAGQCQPKLAIGVSCVANGDCQSGYCVDGICCGSACLGACDRCDGTTPGTCTPRAAGAPGVPSCARSFVCNGTSNNCPTSCTNDAQCFPGTFCNAGSCLPAKAIGNSCTRVRECQSSFCVDGVCCGNACTGQCAQCNAPGSLGTCIAATGKPVGARAACAGDGAACAGVCDGVNVLVCSTPGSSVSCGAAECVDDVQTEPGSCDGAGQCSGKKTPCAPYHCGATACLTSCITAANCVAGADCVAGKCVGGVTDAGAEDAGPLDAGPVGTDAPLTLDDGCGCEVAGRSSPMSLAVLALLALPLARRRRR